MLLAAGLAVACTGPAGDTASTPTPQATATVTPIAEATPTSTATLTPTIVATRPLGAQFELGVAETIRLESTGRSLSLEGVTADSRCPEDVTCVWAGEVTAVFAVLRDDATQAHIEVTLGPNTDATVSFDSFALTLVAVSPQPRTSTPIAPEDYVASVIVERVPSQGRAGIQGLVTLGPLCPVARQDQPCSDRPYAALILITDTDGKEVARVMSGQDGRYSQILPPGTYRVVPQTPPDNILPFAADLTVLINAGEWPTLDISYDTGIR